MTIIQVEDITDGTIGGTGDFDKLMVSIDTHLNRQYTSGRIKGSDYASVYLGAIQGALAQAISFVLAKQQADKLADETAASTVRNDAQSTQDLLNKVEQLLVLTEQRLKLTEERKLVTQKTATEEAQTLDSTTLGTTPGVVAGILSKQKALLSTQTQGFTRDAEQKTLKIMMDSFAVRRSTDSGALPPSKAEDPDIDAFILKAAAGIGVVLPDTFSISVIVTGLSAPGLVLQNNGGDDLTIDADGTYAFHTTMPDLAAYAVTILAQPGSPTLYTDSDIDSPASNIATANIVVNIDTTA